MIQAFRDLGNEVSLVSLVQPDDKDANISGTSWQRLVPLVPTWFYEVMQIAYNVVGYHRLVRAIQGKKPELIYERYSLNTLCGIWAGRKFGIPLLLEVNAPLYYEQNMLGKLKFKSLARITERYVCSNSTRTIVVSSVMKNMLIQEGVPEHKIVVMTNGIDPVKFSPDVAGAAIRKKYCLDHDVIIGFVGWFRKWHGLELLLEVFHQSDLARHARLLLVGDGPAKPDLVQYTECNNLESKIIFTGPVKRTEIASYIAAMDIAIQPSAPEYACPMKIIEYMGMAKCIVAPDQPNIREILEHGKTAYLFQPGHKASLQTILQELLTNQAARVNVGKNAHRTVFERGYLWRENAKRCSSLITNT